MFATSVGFAPLDKIAQLRIKTVVPAHGELGDVDLLRRQRDFIADMWNQVKQGLKAGKSSSELKKTLQFTEHGIFARDAGETEDMIESMCERAHTQLDWNPGPGDQSKCRATEDAPCGDRSRSILELRP